MAAAGTAAPVHPADAEALARHERVRAARLRLTMLVGSLAAMIVVGFVGFLLFLAGGVTGALGLTALRWRMLAVLLLVGAPLVVGASVALVRLARPVAARARGAMRAVFDRQLLWRMRVMLRPRTRAFAGGEVAGATFAGDEVGRGYFDIVTGAAPSRGACWLAAGDIDGVTLEAGLVFLTVQSAFNALAQYRSDVAPADVLRVLGQVLEENVRHRLRAAESVRLVVCLLRPDGSFLHASTPPAAGVRVCRAADGALVEPGGRLAPGDLLVLHTDSLVGARSPAGEAYGAARLGAELARLRDQPPQVLCRELEASVARWVAPAPPPGTLVVARFDPGAGS